MSALNKQLYEFGPFFVDGVKRLLLREGKQVPLKSKTMDTLLVLIQHRDSLLEKDELMRQVWPDTIVEEANLAQNICMLRRVLGDNPTEHRYIVTVPGRGYRFVAAVKDLGAEPEPPPVVPEAPVSAAIEASAAAPSTDLKKQVSSSFGRLRSGRATVALYSTLIAIVAAASYLLGHSTSGPAKSRTGARSIAVLPFKSLGSENPDEYMGLAMADALITKLSSIREIPVRPTSSVLKFADINRDPLAACRELGVDSLLDGKIQRSDDRIRVTVQLVRVSDGIPLWAESFDEKFTNIFAVQDSISQQVTQQLAPRLTGEEKKQLTKRYTDNTEAYQFYVKGRYHWYKRTAEGLNKSIDYFKQSIEQDPAYALAYSGLADCYDLLSYFGGLQPKDSFPKAREAATRALELDETLAEAHVSLGLVKADYEWDWKGAEQEYKRAIELNPKYATAHQWYGEFLAAMGRQDEALAEIKMAQQLDPLSLITNAAAGYICYYGKRYDEAVDQLKRTLELDPNFEPANWFLGWAYEQKHMYREAIQEYQKAKGASSSNAKMMADLAHAYAVSGRRSEAQKILSDLKDLSRNHYVPPYSIARVYSGLGDKDQTFQWLQKAYQDRPWELVFLKHEPVFKDLHSDPRFGELVSQIGLP
jgi:DNA-binding winged helix-turn-helix (wHTH) protein/TolB-like protein/tetratricopeptide (TPR) repeat protein